MQPLTGKQITAMIAHLSGDYSTLRIAFNGGHRETLIMIEDPGSSSDGFIVGQTYGGNRIDFHTADVASITYVQADEKVMTSEEIAAHKGGTTPIVPASSLINRRPRKKPAAAAKTGQPDEKPRKA